MVASGGGQGRLIGRAAEVAAVRELVAPGRVVTLTGAGGAGKTRIARRVIAEGSSGRWSSAWVVELADATEQDMVGELVAGALDLQVPSGAWDGSVLADFFADRPGLLVLDNCEHRAAGVAGLVSDLLAACPGLSILATSRLPLGVTRETVYQVPPLPAPEPGVVVDLESAAGYDSIALYVSRAAEAMATFRLTAENVVSVGALVARLEGLPLAIELAAARVRFLSPDALLNRIDDHLALLETELRDVPSRQRSLAASVGWSHELCSPAERELWARLSVFTGGFELEAAELICAGDGIAPGEVLVLLSALVDMSVVGRVGETGSRFRMLETIRQFGAERLAASGAAAHWRDRHLEWYAALVARLEQEWVGPDQLAWMDWLRIEHPNLRAALEHAVGSPTSAAVALRMCRDLEPLWICGGHLGEARRWIERAIAGTDGAHQDKVAALRLCAWFAALQLDLGYARTRVEDAAGLLDASDHRSRGDYLFAAGVVATWEQDFEEGVARLVESARAYADAGHGPGVLEAQLNRAIAHVFAGDYESAGAVCRACLEVTDPLGETYIGAYARWALGLAALMSGDVAEAAELEQDGLARSSSLGDQLAMALQLEVLAWLAAIQFDFDRAVPLLGGAELFWRMMSMPVALTPGVSDFRSLGEAQVRSQTGDAFFDEAFARGLAMAPHDVVTMGLSSHPTSVDEVARGQRTGPLSRRETEVAALIAEGLTNRDIAERLFLSERTVQGHVQSILRKLDFRSRSRVAVWFVGESGA
ncbi:ATP-binding protein [Nocardioides aromaticivorans]|uniref:ATP-binding protein n=1 Tax=Nocardioides aromaticivorans TaxID=200618 RepID=UPI001F5C20E5|nr:LuxR C-terminal-related transcriptional regulator [Nocardioides aromaticivorans]